MFGSAPIYDDDVETFRGKWHQNRRPNVKWMSWRHAQECYCPHVSRNFLPRSITRIILSGMQEHIFSSHLAFCYNISCCLKLFISKSWMAQKTLAWKICFLDRQTILDKKKIYIYIYISFFFFFFFFFFANQVIRNWNENIQEDSAMKKKIV